MLPCDPYVPPKPPLREDNVMCFAEVKKLLDSYFLVRALWWFIDNIHKEHPEHANTYYYLRDRVRRHEDKNP